MYNYCGCYRTIPYIYKPTLNSKAEGV